MADTFAQMKRKLKMSLGMRSDLEDIDNDNYYGIWINTAYRDFSTKDKFWQLRIPVDFKFPELETTDSSLSTVDGTKTVNTPDDCLVIQDIWNSTSDALLERFHNWHEYVKKTGRGDTDQEGQPTKYIRRDTHIYFYPTPDATYALEVYYRKIPVALSADTDTTEISEIWDFPILKLAVIYGLMHLHQYDKAKIEKGEWIDLVGSMIDIYSQERRNRDSDITIDPIYFDWDY